MLTLPNRFVDVDGRRAHLVDVGRGRSVVLEAGAGGCAPAWLPVLAQLSDRARVVAVDRPGAGWSDPGPDLLPGEIAARLHLALVAADVPPPYLLVGHSLGAFHVRAFASRYPDVTTGLLLLDPSHEDMGAVLDASWSRRMLGAVVEGALTTAAAVPGGGGCRLLGPLLAPERLLRLLTPDPEQRALLRHLSRGAAGVRAALRERRSVEAACAEMRSITDNVDVPMRLLSAAAFDGSREPDPQRSAINALHADLVRRWSDGQHVICAGTTHLFPIERPSLVRDAVMDMLD